jgi:tetratricopeptide (TPR) repeat protein
MDPADSRTYFHRGMAKNNIGELDAAIEDYSQAIQLEPGNANTLSGVTDASFIGSFFSTFALGFLPFFLATGNQSFRLLFSSLTRSSTGSP